MPGYLDRLKSIESENGRAGTLQNLQNQPKGGFVGFVGTPPPLFEKTQPHQNTDPNPPDQKPEPVLCIDCQHYRFGYDHMGNVARCHAGGGFRGVLIERPERRRECGGFVVYQGVAWVS